MVSANADSTLAVAGARCEGHPQDGFCNRRRLFLIVPTSTAEEVQNGTD